MPPTELDTDEQAGIMTNLKKSIVRGFSNVFGSPKPEKKKQVKQYLCECPEHKEYPFMCQRAYEWYALSEDRADISIDLDKLTLLY